MSHLAFVLPAWLFVVGLYGIATSRHFVRIVVALGVMQSSTYVLILLAGFRSNATSPIFSDVRTGVRTVDPVVHALTLTDIVVGATVSALLLALTVRIHARRGTVDPQRARPMSG